MKSIGAHNQVPNELWRLDLKIGHQDSSSNNGHHGDMLHCPTNRILEVVCETVFPDTFRNNSFTGHIYIHESTHEPQGDVHMAVIVIFTLISGMDFFSTSNEIAFMRMPQEDKMGSGSGLVPSGDKPLFRWLSARLQ